MCIIDSEAHMYPSYANRCGKGHLYHTYESPCTVVNTLIFLFLYGPIISESWVSEFWCTHFVKKKNLILVRCLRGTSLLGDLSHKYALVRCYLLYTLGAHNTRIMISCLVTPTTFLDTVLIALFLPNVVLTPNYWMETKLGQLFEDRVRGESSFYFVCVYQMI